MTKLYQRVVRATINTKRYEGLDMTFNVVSSLRPEPNTVELSIWNLNEESRAAVVKKQVPVIVEAGYAKTPGEIFKGYLRDGASENKGVDWITTLISGDGDEAWRDSRVSESFAKGSKVDDVIKALFTRLGPTVNAQNAIEAVKKGKFREALTEFTKGTVLYGKTVEELDKLIKSKKMQWFIEGGQVQVINRDAFVSGPAFKLTHNSGLIGSPQVGEGTTVKVTALLQPAMRLGRQLVLDSDTAKGTYRIEKLTHNGDTASQNFYTLIEARTVGGS